ncbi:MAG: 3-oxoacyl-[acyl-carrier-protein] reductase [Deltaproteobacteria bacterium]
MNDFAGQVALVTGGSRGIGRACAVAFAKRGARVGINYAGNEAAAAETAKLVSEAGGEAKLLRFDVADAEASTQAVEALVSDWGRLDVLVNNAGVAVDGLVLRLKEADLDRQLAVNVKGALYLSKAAARPMMKQRQGSIVNLSSVVGEMGNAGQVVYSATKAALIGLTKSLAKELASRNIRVNAVAPGFIDTDMTERIPEAQRQELIALIPSGRLGSADDVANAVLFLASSAASYVTGEVLRVNGGMYM